MIVYVDGTIVGIPALPSVFSYDPKPVLLTKQINQYIQIAATAHDAYCIGLNGILRVAVNDSGSYPCV